MAQKPSQPGPVDADSPETPVAPAVNRKAKTRRAANVTESPGQKGGDATDPEDAKTPAARPLGKGTRQTSGGAGRGGSTTDTLKRLLESYLATSTLQTDYQALYRSLPAVVGIASEILKKKEAGDAALHEGVVAVERILGDARDKAEQLSKAMMTQQDALNELLQNKESLTELLKTSQNQVAARDGMPPHMSPGATALADPKIAYQLNTLMGNINSMVSREVERQLGALRGEAQQQSQRGR